LTAAGIFAGETGGGTIDEGGGPVTVKERVRGVRAGIRDLRFRAGVGSRVGIQRKGSLAAAAFGRAGVTLGFGEEMFDGAKKIGTEPALARSGGGERTAVEYEFEESVGEFPGVVLGALVVAEVGDDGFVIGGAEVTQSLVGFDGVAASGEDLGPTGGGEDGIGGWGHGKGWGLGIWDWGLGIGD
jgi:hypothetical protein